MLENRIIIPESQQYEEERSDHHFRTEIPNIVYELGLSPYEMMAYNVIKRTCSDGGACWKRNSVISVECCMGETKFRDCLKVLSSPFKKLNGKSLIRVEQRKKEDGSPDTNLVVVVNIWRENGDYFRSKGGTSRGKGGVPRQTNHPSQGGGTSPNEDKEEPLFKEQQQQEEKDVVVVFSDKKENEIVEDPELKAKLKILRNYSLTTEFFERASTFSLLDIENAAKATEQYKESILEKGETIDSESGIFRKALEQRWVPQIPKEEKKDSNDLKEKNIEIAKEYKEIYEKEKNERAPFAFNHESHCKITCLYLNFFNKGKRMTNTLSIIDENFEKILSDFLGVKRNQ